MSNWIPLESNPDVLTKYIRMLGVPSTWSVIDIVGLEDEMLEWVVRPVIAIILLCPESQSYVIHRAKEHERMLKLPAEEQYPAGLFYMRQKTRNACGTIALIHSIANSKDIEIGNGVLKDFIHYAQPLSPEERADILDKDEAFAAAHRTFGKEGQTQGDANELAHHHFVSFVNVDGTLYELDGSKSFPIKHGATSEETFIKDAARVCKEFIARDPDDVHFTVLAITAAQE